MQQRRALRFNTILATLTLCQGVAIAQETQEDSTRIRSQRSPVTISRHALKFSRQQHKVEIQLKLADGIEINSEHKHKLLNSLQLQILDGRRNPIHSTITYPKAKVVPLEKELGGDFRVYTGTPTFVAICDESQTPAYVTVRYSGTRYRRS